MSQQMLVRVTTGDLIELLAALRLTAARYQRHLEATRQYGSQDSVRYWQEAIDRIQGLIGLITVADRLYLAKYIDGSDDGTNYVDFGVNTEQAGAMDEPPF